MKPKKNETMTPKQFSDIRDALDMNNADIARELGLKRPGTISDFASGTQRITERTAKQIVELFRRKQAGTI